MSYIMPAADTIPPSNHTILVATHSPTVQNIILYTLKRAGMQAVTTENGMEAITIIGQEKPGLVFLDLQLSPMDGYSVCQIIRRNSQFRDMPIVLMGRNPRSEKTRVELAGATDYLKMPFASDQLLEIVRKYLPAHRED